MRNAIAAALVCGVFLGISGAASRANAQTGTHEETASGGWAGPCDDWWTSTDFVFEAERVCRVATYVLHGLRPSIDPAAARVPVNQLFRICWGTFQRANGDCSTSNAWAMPRSWIDPSVTTKPPVVITLRAAENVQSDDEMAAVLSHEMGHAIDANQTLTPSRENELRADANAVGFLMMAGYDARSAGRGLQMIMGERGQGAVGNLLGMLNHAADGADVHGYASDRIAQMKQVYATGCTALKNKPIGCKEGWR